MVKTLGQLGVVDRRLKFYQKQLPLQELNVSKMFPYCTCIISHAMASLPSQVFAQANRTRKFYQDTKVLSQQLAEHPATLYHPQVTLHNVKNIQLD